MSEEQYEKVCRNEFNKINEKLDKLDHRLFEDNGGECIQSKINRDRDWIDTQKVAQRWIIALVLGAIILSCVNGCSNYILRMAMRPMIEEIENIDNTGAIK